MSIPQIDKNQFPPSTPRTECDEKHKKLGLELGF